MADRRERFDLATFVPPWYRFAELEGLSPRERARVVEDAAERATTHPRMLVAWAVTLAALALAARAWSAGLQQAPVPLVVAGALLAFLPLFLLRRGVVHARVAQVMAARRDAASPPPDSR
ncbi:MAG: hypothetical protein MUF03_00705 [Rubrivivax sp.]|jgi:hypothetical protein|nr:hypothetical protein [Rubrivivax sp.]